MSISLLQCCPNMAQLMKCGCDVAVATNESDVKIAQTVCCAIVAIVLIAAVGFLLWKLMDYLFKKNQNNRRHKWEEKEKERSKVVELQNMKLEILKELCYDVNEKDKKVIKREGGDVEKYATAIDYYLGINNPSKEGKDEK